MKSKNTCKIHRKELSESLTHWFSYGAGLSVSNLESALLKNLSKDIFGYHLILIEDFGNISKAFQECPVNCQTILRESIKSPEKSSIHARGEEMPLANDSIDLAVLPHTLDFSEDPQQILRETERVLIPEGRLLIVGFNPISLWGVWRIFFRKFSKIPWCAHFFTQRRISDWLSLLGFDIECVDVCSFFPPVKNRPLQKYFSSIEKFGSKYLTMVAGIYVVRAVKRVSTVRPIESRWANLQKFGKRAVEPTARNKIHEK